MNRNCFEIVLTTNISSRELNSKYSNIKSFFRLDRQGDEEVWR